MRKILFLFLLPILLSSCGTLMLGVKKSVYLVDAPRDVQVLKNGSENLKVDEILLGSYEARGTKTKYFYPGFRTKIKKGDFVTIKGGDENGKIKLETKRQVGLLVIEGIFTLGVFTAVDLITGGDKKPMPKFIDVPAVLNNKKPRSQKDLRKAAYTSY